MRKVAITNMTGARNRGCQALVDSILLGLEEAIPGAGVSVDLYSRDSDFDRDCFGDRVAAVRPYGRRASDDWAPNMQRNMFWLMNMLPRQMMLAPSMRHLGEADLIIATGGDVFTSDYGDFTTHARVLQVGPPVALLGQTVGPFTPAAEEFFRNSTENLAFCTVRETESLEYLKDIIPDVPVAQTADVAFLLPATDPEASRYILEVEHHFPIHDRRLIALSVSSGILTFCEGLDPDAYVREVAALVNAVNAEGFSVVLIPHVQERAPRNNDMIACRAVLNACADPAKNLLLSVPTLTASDYKGIIGLCEALVGARTHATIASLSQGIPTVSIAYSRKAWGIMRDYYGPTLGKALTLDVASLDRYQLKLALELALANGKTTGRAAEMKRRAASNFDLVRSFLYDRAVLNEEAPSNADDFFRQPASA